MYAAMRSLLVIISGFSLLALNAVAGQLPDTGQSTCYNTSGATDCVADTGFPRQDGSQIVPLGYTKLDAGGLAVAASASQWDCVRDNATQLVWEIKSADGGLRDRNHRYAWSGADVTHNGGDAGGTTETAWCSDSLNGKGCTTENYVAAVNAAHLCGASDWRLPTQRELLSLIHAGKLNPAVDAAFLPNTLNDVYWSANTYARIPAFAWGVHFGYGAANADYKNRGYRVRLVRGAAF